MNRESSTTAIFEGSVALVKGIIAIIVLYMI